MNNTSIRKAALQYLAIIGLSIAMALNYEIFIIRNQFAPAGIGGIATIVQYLFDFNIGYLTLLINIPLSAVAFFIIDRDFTLKSLTFAVVFSLALLVLNKVDLSALQYYTSTGTSTILAPVAAGGINGVIYACAMKLNGSTGGTDIIAACIQKRKPYMGLMKLIFILNVFVAGISYFVYGFSMEPVLLCVIYCFITRTVNERFIKGGKEAVKCEVITLHAEEIAQRIITELRHSATVWDAEGMYSHSERKVLICVINKNQLVKFQTIVRNYPDTFAYVSNVTETVGNFKRIRE